VVDKTSLKFIDAVKLTQSRERFINVLF